MFMRQMLAIAERWWIILIGLGVIGLGTVMMFDREFWAVQGYNDATRSWTDGLTIIGMGLVFMLVWSIPPIARWRRSLFRMDNLAFHHQVTLLIGALGPGVGLILILNALVVIMANLSLRYCLLGSPQRTGICGMIGLSLVVFLVISFITRERELKRRRHGNLCEICAYGLVEENRLCTECGRTWPLRKKSVWLG
jgi:hypothetical protein